MATQPSKPAAPSTPPEAITFIVPGQVQASRSGGNTPTAATDLPGRVKAAVRVSARRSGGDSTRLSAVPGQDVVLLRIDGGPALVLHPETARDLMLSQSAAKRSATPAGNDVPVPAQLRWQGLEQATPTRSGGFLGDVLLSGFEVITDLFKDKAVGFVADKIVDKLDGQVDAGVYALNRHTLAPLKGSGHKLLQVPAPADPAKEPLLVLIHGTFVDTASTFSKLWALHPQRVVDLFDHYNNRVYALDHPTVGASPISNALTLVQALPAGARLHLVTHSRGGLVAEVLARVAGQGAITAADLMRFEDRTIGKGKDSRVESYEKQRQELKALAAAMQAKNIQVDRVLRVACPAHGTLLASKRLDAYLSVLKWTIELAGIPVLPALVDFLTQVAQRRTRPEELPGLAAMIPDAPLLNWLNSGEEGIPGDLRVVAGDLQGDSVISWLKTLLADAYYWTDNDIVVQTRSMYGGSPRAGGASFLLDQSGKSTHFNYFANDRTATAVVNGLMQASPAGFATIGPLSWRGDDASGQRSARRSARSNEGTPAHQKPAVFVLPGILGSHLKAGDKRIWLSLRLIGGLDKLKYQPKGADHVLPDGPIGMVYDDLMDHLALTHDVKEFSFDWRRPIEEEAERLADAVEAALEERKANTQPVRILAHSMGGVVTRTMLLRRPKTFKRMMDREGARFVMLGTPNGGSWAPMQVLSGDDTFGNALASFGSPLRDQRARQLMAEMPGFLQLQAKLLDPQLGLDRESTWADLAKRDLEAVQQANWWHRSFGEDNLNSTQPAYSWGVPPQAVLDQARSLRLALDAQLEGSSAAGAGQGALREYADRMALVVGSAKLTPVGYEWTDKGLVYLNVSNSAGDGRVPLESAQLPGVRTWTLDCEHGTLPDARQAFDAYLDLLTQGDTQRLPRLDTGGQRSARSNNSSRGSAAPPQPVVLVQSRPSRARPAALPAANLRDVLAATGVPAGPADRTTAPPLRVQVLNGNLSFVRGTLMVGHTRALQLTGTEKVVNRLVGGAMKDSLDAGLYPDATGTHQVFLNTSADPDNPWRAPQPASVVVVGLGEEGKLSERELTRSVRQGVVAWAQRTAEGTLASASSASSSGNTSNTAGSAGTEDRRWPSSLELHATLMGSGGAGMSASTAARAIAQGVREANQRMAASADARWPQVSHLTLVELYLERASDAWQGLHVLQSAAPEQFEVEPTIKSGVGPLRRQMDSGYRGTDYDFIAATSTALDTIAFRLDTKRARTEVTAQSTQGKLLRALVKRASSESNRNPLLGRTLFQLLVPLEVEPFLAGTSRMLLELDDKTAAIPWELLDTRSSERAQQDEEPWAIRTKLLRKLQQEHYRQQVQDAQVDDAVLVIGEPQVNTEEYVALPGARAEAEAVRDALISSGGLEPERVVALIDNNDASSIINGLFDKRYRIVHVAGHGEPIKRDKDGKITDVGGVVLSEGAFLGPHEIHAMRTVPELVFVNCCHLAARDADQTLRGGAAAKANFDRAEFAMGVADALISIGVRCVVAAGWAVDDQPAKVFAEAFYRQILARRPFIDAVAEARKAAWKADRNSNTWAAYQAYGDPDWVYRRGPNDTMSVTRSPEDEFESVASPLGLALALEEQAVRVKWMHEDRAAQLEKVRHLETRFGALWGGMGAVAEAFAVAYSEAGGRDEGIAWYERALLANDGSASLRAQEQLGNLLARRGWDRARQARDKAQAAASASERAPGEPPSKGPAGKKRTGAKTTPISTELALELQIGREDIVAALRGLQTLCSLQPTAERLSLCGSAHKRLAMLDTLAGSTALAQGAMASALAFYEKAEALAQATDDPRLYYPALNRMALAFAHGGGRADWAGFDAAHSALVRRKLQRAAQHDPAFDNQMGLIELDLYEAAARKNLAGVETALIGALRNLRLKAPGLNGWQSAADQTELVLGAYKVYASAREKAAAQAVVDALDELAKDA